MAENRFEIGNHMPGLLPCIQKGKLGGVYSAIPPA